MFEFEVLDPDAMGDSWRDDARADPPGTTFAYLLLKPKWDANQKQNWKRIEDWEDDQWSLY